jgi:hypothetical protein
MDFKGTNLNYDVESAKKVADIDKFEQAALDVAVKVAMYTLMFIIWSIITLILFTIRDLTKFALYKMLD